MGPIQTLASRDALYAAAAERIADAMRVGVDALGEGVAALSGGTTPEPAYAFLSAKNLEWAKLRFLLVDERFVPPDHPESNEALLRRALRKPLASGARLSPLFSDTTPENAAAAANAAYAGSHIDIAVMGMGADGHTASWFPASPQLAGALDPGNDRTVIAVEATGAAGSAHRLTLTLAAVARSHRVLLLITGEEKRAVLEQALSNGATPKPVAALARACAGKLETLWAA